MATRPIWQEKPSTFVSVLKVLVLAFTVVVTLYPFIYVIAVSLSNPKVYTPGDLLLWPKGFTTAAYQLIMAGQTVPRALVVSVCVTTVGTLVSMFCTVTMAYGLSRTSRVPGARPILLLVLFTMLFSAGIIPSYLVVRGVGLLDNYLALIVPGAISAFNLVVIRNFFMNIPEELYDAARIDGAGELQILWRVVLPLSKAVLAVIALFYGVGYWNSFFEAMLYLNEPRMWPIQLILRQYVLQAEPLGDAAREQTQVHLTPETIQMTVLVLATVPILLVYPFLQRFFTKGVLTGAIKG
ncbi:putative aldouronate transport system permease protein [Actinopolymorpha cephalotaxi]|uniref:Aldouronate transport system permease protein n=1 Tax=Actinopolymorpha cephalotaxi TaxID=504797 RepID=A0A1I2K9Q4_9ACTN|nr:carbohydrate ABC transporter permease [Actinopolymorpha cephalotaxi]NYH85952.1 putative aldouronate transport system permease protein [Actinopolymorpha cephalotaxi]SFF61861.1 putative aldouronate transport system permease protein [Actinopolymorpha cephalotaxi]